MRPSLYLCALLVIAPRAAIAEDTRPNIVLVTLDTCRADRLGCYGYGLARTPAIDALAKDGVLCSDAIAVAPITLVSHASMMTGLLPPAHGVRDNGGFALADGYTTLAEVLKQNGYATAAFVSAVVLARRYNLSQGFDVYDDDLWAEDEPRLFMIRDRPAPRTAARAVEWLRARAAGPETPFFLWVHFFDPHQPYESRYRDRHLSPTPYDAEIAQADEGVAAIVDTLRIAGALDSTFVAVTADHGESLGEHGELTHAVFVYDATVRIPLVLRYPAALPRGATYDGPVSGVDIFPTLLAAAGIAAPENQGIDLVPGLRGGPIDARRPLYSESLLSQVGFGMAPLYAIRQDGRKFVRAPKPELYDMKYDPRELTNLYAGQTPETEKLDTVLQRTIDESARYARSAPAIAPDAETLDALRALGYLAPDSQRAANSGMDPKDGMALYSQLEDARHAAQRGDYAASEKLLRAVLATAPHHVTARNVLGLVLSRMGRFEDAAREYRASLESDPAQARVLHMLGVLYARQKDLAQARTYCRRALDLSPNLVESMVVLGFAALQDGDKAEAERWYRRAVEADPSMPRAQLAYADLFYLRENFADALKHYRRVLEALPNHFAATLQAGLCALRMNKPDDAAALFERAARLRPDSWMPPYDLACARAQQGRPDDAAALLREAARSAPADVKLREIAERDPDLAPLRAAPAWPALAQELAAY